MAKKAGLIGNKILPSRLTLLAGSGASFADLGPLRQATIEGQKPDAQLILLCAELMRLEDEINNFPYYTISEEKLAERLRIPLQCAREPLFEVICSMKTATLEGAQARARAIAKCAPDIMEEYHDIERIVMALLHDLLAETRLKQV